ncbi:hypothetical protein [Rhodococcus tibetensis]|uniref:Uncharacterized protein n=1 Tax=Rhodococcus tibetensis TaxID=2965064 RepID=A0ABT1QB25_9NOCA|nr:hypothetical protein [Rhodococcus sp. FXJ9.536]MCQ4118920.1 hypothetical protein [Rhodococcus sp. FXJ9.536]
MATVWPLLRPFGRGGNAHGEHAVSNLARVVGRNGSQVSKHQHQQQQRRRSRR